MHRNIQTQKMLHKYINTLNAKITKPRYRRKTQHQKNSVMIFIFLAENSAFTNRIKPSHIISHITDFALQNHLHCHKQGIAHVICKSQIVAPDANRCTEAKCQRGSGRSQHQTLKWFETVSKGGAEFASEPNIDRASIFNGTEKKKRKKMRKGEEAVAWPAHPSFL